MKKTILIIPLIILGIICCSVSVLAYGDGYTDCERDPIYERDFSAQPTISLNLRERACMSDSPVINVLSPTQTYQVIAETDGWYKVKLSDGTIGWAGAGLMRKVSADSGSGEKIEAIKTEVKEIKKETATLNESVKERIKEKVKGYILLQVESVGEAWYVNPIDGNRYYLKDGDAAFLIMRNFGLGINNADLLKLKDGNYDLVNRLRGRIVLAVQANGEAYYIHPKDGKVHYLKNGAEAFKLMRYLSLGITNENLKAVTAKEKIEYLYNKKEEIKKEVKKVITEPTASDGTITLDGYVENGKVYLNWQVAGFESAKGFKVVYSESENPVYPGNTYHYLSNPDVRSDFWKDLKAGKTYYFRVCEYLGGKCGVYSNNLMVSL